MLRTPERRDSRSGFTLVELLAVIAIIGLLIGLAVPLVNKAQQKANVTACQQNMRNVAGVLKVYVESRGKNRWPRDQGVKLLLRPYQKNEIKGKELDVYVCPGTNDTTWPTEDEEGQFGAGFEDWDNIDVTCISYAGRDAKTHEINKNDLGDMVIASDDNDGRANHPNVTNIVYADTSISQLDLSNFEDQLDEGAEWIPVGPDSPSEILQKLMVDF